MLIVDLDKLHFPFTTARPEYAQGVQDLHKAILKCKIDAIPVEWIETYVKNKFCLAEWYGGFIGGINMMLDDWEKENANR